MSARRWSAADLAITVGFLALFAYAFFQARMWPFRTTLFPTVITSFVIGIILLKLVLDLTSFRRRTPAAVEAPAAEGPIEEEQAAEAELEDIFETAPRSAWLAALGWMAAFFVLLWTLGIFVTVPLFTFAYLLLSSRESFLLAGGYAAATWVFIYGLFDQVLHIPLPTGVVLGALGG